MTSTTSGVTTYIGLGSNLGDTVATLGQAEAALARLPESGNLVCSSLYRSAPIGFTDQPDFINAVCRLETRLAPLSLLTSLLQIEQRHGRVRSGSTNAPRTLDLDLLMYGDQFIAETGLVVPHPRLHERAFVLYPLLEIAPDLSVPGQGPIVELVKDCVDQSVTRLTDTESSQ
jgi:2-amino-4-hydroxy-6-hydroxymethyldihydropteridine diphosphokinase